MPVVRCVLRRATGVPAVAHHAIAVQKNARRGTGNAESARCRLRRCRRRMRHGVWPLRMRANGLRRPVERVARRMLPVRVRVLRVLRVLLPVLLMVLLAARVVLMLAQLLLEHALVLHLARILSVELLLLERRRRSPVHPLERRYAPRKGAAVERRRRKGRRRHRLCEGDTIRSARQRGSSVRSRRPVVRPTGAIPAGWVRCVIGYVHCCGALAGNE